MSLGSHPDDDAAESMAPASPQTNPFERLVAVWRLAEKIAMSISVILVVGTVGYLSIHALV